MQTVLDPRAAQSEAAPAANRPGAEPVVRPDGRREGPCRRSLFSASSCIEALDRGSRTSVLPPARAASAVLVRQPQSSISHPSSSTPPRPLCRRTLAPPFPRMQARFPGSSPELTPRPRTAHTARLALPWQPYATPPPLHARRELTDSAAAAVWAHPNPTLTASPTVGQPAAPW